MNTPAGTVRCPVCREFYSKNAPACIRCGSAPPMQNAFTYLHIPDKNLTEICDICDAPYHRNQSHCTKCGTQVDPRRAAAAQKQRQQQAVVKTFITADGGTGYVYDYSPNEQKTDEQTARILKEDEWSKGRDPVYKKGGAMYKNTLNVAASIITFITAIEVAYTFLPDLIFFVSPVWNITEGAGTVLMAWHKYFRLFIGVYGLLNYDEPKRGGYCLALGALVFIPRLVGHINNPFSGIFFLFSWAITALYGAYTIGAYRLMKGNW